MPAVIEERGSTTAMSNQSLTAVTSRYIGYYKVPYKHSLFFSSLLLSFLAAGILRAVDGDRGRDRQSLYEGQRGESGGRLPLGQQAVVSARWGKHPQHLGLGLALPSSWLRSSLLTCISVLAAAAHPALCHHT